MTVETQWTDADGKPLDGGPAHATWHGDPGMSLRDWFAGEALGSVIAGNIIMMNRGSPGLDNATLAKMSYGMADAMLKARRA